MAIILRWILEIWPKSSEIKPANAAVKNVHGMSSSSCRAISMDLPHRLPPPFSIVHRSRLVFKVTYCISTQLLYIRPCWSPGLCSSMWGVHRGTSLMCSSLLLQQCPAYLVRLTWIVFVMGGRWPYSCCFVRCCLQDLFNIARSVLVFSPKV